MRTRYYARARAELREIARWSRLLQEEDQLFESLSPKRRVEEADGVGVQPMDAE